MEHALDAPVQRLHDADPREHRRSAERKASLHGQYFRRRLKFPELAIEENRFVLFVDIAGSTGLAERLGGLAIHRLLDHTFRLLTVPVVDYRGEVLNYVGDEVIVTWPERGGAVDCRPLRCFMAMRDELTRAASQLEHEFGSVPRIRGSLHFGPVIVGEIGDIKRAIVFNGDVMNTAARLEELSRGVEGGFLVSRAAMVRVPMKPAMHSNSKPAGYSNRKPATLGVNRMGRFDDVVEG
jgi:class 3 adenylate cyclase